MACGLPVSRVQCRNANLTTFSFYSHFITRAVWLLGNLARATYVGSSDYMWPFSYDQCTEENRHSQEVNACSRVGHYGMQPGVGRGAPEIDVLEAMQGDHSKLPNTRIRRPYVSASLQVSLYSSIMRQHDANQAIYVE